MEEIKLAFEAIGLFQQQYSLVDKLWGYFGVVTLAAGGYVVGSEKATRSLKEVVAIVVMYLVFCVGNHIALVEGQRQLQQLSVIARDLSRKAKLDLSTLEPIRHEWVSRFHLTVALVVSLGILLIAWLRLKEGGRSTKIDKTSDW